VGVVTKKKDVYIKEGKTHIRYLYFSLHNSDQQFVIRPRASYPADLTSALATGDTLKVFFRPARGYNQYVYQIEKDGKVLADYLTFNENESVKAAIGLFGGFFLILFSILRFRRVNLWRFLNNLVR
jgi:hypothetical protein